MSWHTWCFGRQKSARTPCSGSRKEQMAEMNGVWHIHLYPSPTAQSWGSNISWLVTVMGNSYSGRSSTTILGICVNDSKDPTPFHFSLKWFGPEEMTTDLAISSPSFGDSGVCHILFRVQLSSSCRLWNEHIALQEWRLGFTSRVSGSKLVGFRGS